MSIVGDLREALQDVVAPDLKAVVQGLASLREEVREGNALLRKEIEQSRQDAKESNTLLRHEIEQSRQDAKESNSLLRKEIEQARHEAQEKTAQLREDTREHIALLRDESRAAEARSVERLEHLHHALKLAISMQRNIDLEQELQQMRNARQAQQH